MILTVTPNPCVDKTVFLDEMAVGEKNVCRRVTTIPGGKGNNVARVVAALGEKSSALVLVGGPPGQHVVDMIRHDDHLPCHPVWIGANTRTITTVLEEGPHRQTPLFEPSPKVTTAERDEFIAAACAAAAGVEIVTLNGTVPDRILEDAYATIITRAKQAGALTILDTHGREFALGLEAAPYMVKPNEAEAAEIVGYALDSDAARWRAVDFFHARGVTLVVLSLGPNGIFISDGSRRFHAIPPAIEEVNAVGSGDALVGAIAVGLFRKWPLEKLAASGVAAGTANAMRWDIGHVSRSEVERIAAQVILHHGPPNVSGG